MMTELVVSELNRTNKGVQEQTIQSVLRDFQIIVGQEYCVGINSLFLF